MLKTKIKIGIDEAGRGPWAGPVVACALALNPNNAPEKSELSEINDSKKLTQKKRGLLYDRLVDFSQAREERQAKVFFGVGVVDAHSIDELGIKEANRLAMSRALDELLLKIPSEIENISVLVDGKDNYEFPQLEQKPLYIIGGDAKVLEIGAASIIAKVFRDKLMQQYASLYPQFGFDTNAGYGTKKHRDSLLEKSDITGIHRQSYAPVKKVTEKKEKLLLHVCCGPDATVPLMDLKKDYEVLAFWYDPNIQPKKEYDKRLEAFAKVCDIEGVEWIEGEYDVKNFFQKIKGLEHTPEKGEKCIVCYDMRLERSALEARRRGIKYWTSTLNTSPHKDLEKMFSLGEKHSKQPHLTSPLQGEGKIHPDLAKKLEFLKIAFRKNGGFQRSVDYTNEYDIYRQNYCGCVYSDTFPGREKADAKAVFNG